MNERREIIMKDGKKAHLIGIFQYGCMEYGMEPLAVIEMADGSIENSVSLKNFRFAVEVEPNATTDN